MPKPDCRQLLAELSSYLEGEASPELCDEIERHLAGCPNCQAVVDTLGKTISLYHTLPEEDVPDEARRRLWRVLHLDLPPR